MSLPDLCLLPHEVGDSMPNEPLCAPAHSRVRVESGLYRGNYLMRRIEGGNEWNPCVARREILDSPLIYIINCESLNFEEIAQIIESGDFYRHLHFDSNYRLTTSPKSRHFDLDFHNESGINWTFQGNYVNIRRVNEDTNNRCSIDWKFDTPDKQIERDIARLISDENSYFSIANWWAQLEHKEKGRQLIKFALGDWEELKFWICRLIWSLDDWNCGVEWHGAIGIPSRGDYSSDSEYIDAIIGENKWNSANEKHQFTVLQSQAFKTILHHFYPRRNAELEELLKFHQIWQGYGRRWPLRIDVPTASAHQRLEAKLQLREFLRDKVSPTELSDLIGNS